MESQLRLSTLLENFRKTKRLCREMFHFVRTVFSHCGDVLDFTCRDKMHFIREFSKAGVHELSCILQLGIGTMFMFIGLDTHSFILESVLHSVNHRDPDRIDQYAGYYG